MSVFVGAWRRCKVNTELDVQFPPSVKTAVTGAKPRRVLFYGGCHAVALHRIFNEFATVPAVFDSIVNFQLIASRQPFPMDKLATCDTIVLSPILNKQNYNTHDLVKRCYDMGIKTVVYPWLQWNGYFPWASKGAFFTVSSWHYGNLPHFKDQEALEDFCREMAAACGDKTAVKTNLQTTTEHLRAHEGAGSCDISIVDFILDNYRSKRLFLTPDHPSKAFYNFFVREISKRINIPVSNSFYWSSAEPQYGIRLPIAPQVTQNLGLSFYDADYQNFMSDLGQRYIHYDEYQKILYGVGKNMKAYRSISATYLKRRPVASGGLSPEDKLHLAPGVVIQVETFDTVDNHLHVRVNWGCSKQKQLDVSSFSDCYMYLPHWEFRSGMRVGG